MQKLLGFLIDRKLVTVLVLAAIILTGVVVSPFAWNTGLLPQSPIPVDAIPDLGENQQIVFTPWKGQSPQDIEDQITYPLTTALLGIPGVKTIRSSSIFGASNIYVIFEEGVDFYWSRSRILEKLNALPPNLLPADVQPSLGPDATALGQVFWYTLEGQDSTGRTTEGWDLHELRTLQDFHVGLALSSTEGVAEVAAIGGHVLEYHIDVDPIRLEQYGITLPQIVKAARHANQEIGANTVEINKVEYFVRGLGYIEDIAQIEQAVVASHQGTSIQIKDLARVSTGPAERRGILDRGGAEAVGGVVVARYGSNPLSVISSVKKKIQQIESGLPEKTLSDGRTSKVKILPFYDRSGLIQETLGTLNTTLSLELLITLIVVLVMVLNVRASLIISSVLPISILACFIAMKWAGIDANIVALSGIAIAIGTMVDIGVILCENILTHLQLKKSKESARDCIIRATSEVAPAIFTAVATTVVSFLPVFTLMHAEGKLFRPLAFTKTFAILGAVGVALLIIPILAHLVWKNGIATSTRRKIGNGLVIAAGAFAGIFVNPLWFWIVPAGAAGWLIPRLNSLNNGRTELLTNLIYAGVAGVILSFFWEPLGPAASRLWQALFTLGVVALVLGVFALFQRHYSRLLNWCLDHKKTFLLIPALSLLFGTFCWLGPTGMFGIRNQTIEGSSFWSSIHSAVPGLSSEFMPSLDEGSFLLMPTSMPHAGIEETKETLAQLDQAVEQIPEVEEVVGKLGRVNSPLDPAPTSMYENLIRYLPEYKQDSTGRRLRFRKEVDGSFARSPDGELIPDRNGSYFRNWREHIHSPEDIWDEIAQISLPGVTSAPRLQPIETRLVMLQSGMRSPMGIKINGPNLNTIEQFGLQLERILKNIKGVNSQTVFAERMVGKPYLTIAPDRVALRDFGLTLNDLQTAISTAIGGEMAGTVLNGRERFTMRVRYPRDYRNNPESIGQILIPTSGGGNVQVSQVTSIDFQKGPQMIRSENTFLQGYVLFDKLKDFSENDVVVNAKETLNALISSGKLRVPAGVSFEFAGNYQNQMRAEKRLRLVLPISLGVILLLLYLQFGSLRTAGMIFSSVAVAFAGGFIMLWLYSKPWFLNFNLGSWNLQDLFQVHPVNLSVAVWVGFLALFGIATDDGVVMGTYLTQEFNRSPARSRDEIHQAVVRAGQRRIRPCLMTTATTLLALLPILTSTGKGSDIMIPMAIPAFGGMTMALITLFVIPVLFAWNEIHKLNKANS